MRCEGVAAVVFCSFNREKSMVTDFPWLRVKGVMI